MPELKYNSDGLIPTIVQESSTGEVLMFAWMNDDALKMTFEKGLVTFWSRSRSELWTKGESSGNVLRLNELRYDCDEDCLLALVTLEGSGACHTGERTCFYRTIDG